ncbi:hypothetical protein UFOVP998_7 [uncultured Caudovirales phage]|uniref:DUF5675 domain-containing protein n=1 Tax=uncultured Caudovirales phage TaxID=2100421 RepID=A0A6J7XAY7_9CAUD|nr:hypothetical protein UFOVP998_7 [uncultured Caudovirales phage]CAB4199491.1 hypothetical protein UFOVP1331_52 [uncultured Caudovirales phage]CAB4212752.1 hypothetical protein UFOVP1442_23 [uncultured Caudovirales phage]CAB5228035.1 hypothetical protein UFOVP1535_28 [uncultured Caudovirales phage]
MKLRLIREPSAGGATLGALYIDDVWFCWTLEDALREVPGRPVAEWKVAGQTAIPSGRYRVRLTKSARLGVVTPEILDVPGYTGIRIHWGNKRQDTEGCPLTGRHRDPANYQVLESRLAFEALMGRLTLAPEIWIDIENPTSYASSAA